MKRWKKAFDPEYGQARSETEEEIRLERRKRRGTRGIVGIACFFGALFIALGGYYAWFLQVRSQQVIGSSYNARLDSFADRVVRGDIVSADGKVLAATRVQEDGTEVRDYPYGYLYVHSVGYAGKNGRTGLESLANFYLLRSHINLLEQVVNEFREKKSPGDRLVTTLRSDLQETASDALGSYRGAVIAMDPSTGKILAMVSQPNFDANTVDERWDELIGDEDNKAMLVNRATQGVYPPGSTFKILTLLEYIREHPADWQDFTFDCSGTFTADGYSIRCYHGEKHGRQTLLEAFANSCNGAFAQIGEGLDTQRYAELMDSVGFNQRMNYDLPSGVSSFKLDGASPEWEKAQTAIGQGKTQITPLLNLMLVSAVANGGSMMKPSLMDHVETQSGQMVKKFSPQEDRRVMSQSEADALTVYMRQVVKTGTGSAFRGAGYDAVGKTGSAETDGSGNSDAWFVGFAPADNPKIAICVVAEDGGSGGAVAAPIARAVLDKYFDGD